MGDCSLILSVPDQVFNMPFPEYLDPPDFQFGMPRFLVWADKGKRFIVTSSVHIQKERDIHGARHGVSAFHFKQVGGV